ncbi:unnamed protein product [Somion occarium]|uniref:Uncharacterized protein n=1 Tax=Somion occarium TaxID=3059160 RepID=A0ABP1D967_9APHY
MATFTPSDAIDMSKEKDWAANLGMLDWDTTRIVFTKRSLIEFLKYTGTTVDTNYSNIQKLPRYAKFGKITGGEEVSGAQTASSSSEAPANQTSDNAFKPSRRVRTAPGGETHNIFGSYEDDDVLSTAPSRGAPAEQVTPPEESKTSEPERARTTTSRSPWEQSEPEKPVFKPSRRVREMPGGRDSIADLL